MLAESVTRCLLSGGFEFQPVTKRHDFTALHTSMDRLDLRLIAHAAVSLVSIIIPHQMLMFPHGVISRVFTGDRRYFAAPGWQHWNSLKAEDGYVSDILRLVGEQENASSSITPPVFLAWRLLEIRNE